MYYLYSKTDSPVRTEKDYLLERKEKDFLKVFDNVVKLYQENNISFKTTDICKMVANSAAPCFYVTQEQALKQYRRYKYGHSNIKSEVRRQMFAEIFVRFENIMRQANMYQYAAMELVLSQPAPCFYLTDISAVLFYYNAMKKKRDKTRAK